MLRRYLMRALGALVVLWLPLVVLGADKKWSAAVSGDFADPARWTGGVPGAGDTATFNAAGAYTVTFDNSPNPLVSPVLNQDLFVDAGTVTFTSGSGGPYTYRLTGTGGDDALITSGALTLGTSGNPLHLTVDDDLVVRGGSTLNVNFGSQVNANDLALATIASGGNGAVIVDGAGSQLNVTLTINAGLLGNTGTLTYRNFATGSLGGVSLANSSNPASAATLNVESGATVTSISLLVGHSNSAAATGTVNVNGSGSMLTVTGGLPQAIGGTAGIGNINVGTTANGGTFSTGTGTTTINANGTVTIGSGANTGVFNANGNLTIDGGTLTRTSGSAFSLAAGKTMTVQNGGAASFAGEYITATDAIYNVTDSGSVLGTSADTFRINNGAEVHVNDGGSLVANMLRMASSGDGTLTVDGPGSSVTGNLSNFWGQLGNTASVTFSNGAIGTFNGTLELGVGGAGTTAIVNILSGAELNANAALGLVSASGGASATLNVEGAGSSVNAASSVSVGHNSDGVAQINIGTTASGAAFTTGTNTLTINKTGTVTIGGGANTGTLDANGNITLEGGVLEKANSASTFDWAAGKTMEIRSGGRFSIDGPYTTATNAVYNIRGSGSTLETMGSFGASLEITNGAAINVSSGGLVSVANVLPIGFGSGNGTLSVDGLGSMVNQPTNGANFWGHGGRTATVVFSNNASGVFEGAIHLADSTSAGSTANLTIQSGADLTADALLLATTGFATSATVTVDGHGSTLSLGSDFALNIGASATSTATVNVQNGAALAVGTDGTTILNLTGTINIDGGTVDLKTLFDIGGTMNFIAGSLSYIGDLTVGTDGLLGENLTLETSRQLTLSGTTTIDAGRTLTLDGGTLNTAALAVNGTLNFNAGTLGVTGPGGLTLGSGGPLGGMLTLGAGRTLNVTSTTTVNSGSLLILENGGGFTSGTVNNSGEIVLDGPAATLVSGPLSNAGRIRGSGRINAPLNNQTAGEVRATTGELLQFFDVASSQNNGRINLLGGTIEFTQSLLTNAASGQIIGNGSLIAAGGIHNDGTMAFSGQANVLGDVTNDDGLIISAGGGPTTFFDDVINDNEIRTSPGSFSVFFGSLSGSGTFTGTGTVNIEGDLSPGASPAIVSFGGNLVLGSAATTLMELGGTTAGSQHDRIDVAGELSFGGTLDVELINGFSPNSGSIFDLFNWNTAAGTFAALDLPVLAADLMWNASELYTTGTLLVVLAGDYNANGVVDAADYVVWRHTLGQSGVALSADGNRNNQIDAGDYDVWRAHFGQTAAGSGATIETGNASAVPEPFSLVPISAAAGIAWVFRGRRRVPALPIV